MAVTVHRNQVCINRSGQAITVYRTYQPAPDFVVPQYDGEWDDQKIDWYWKQLRKPNAMGSSDAIGTLQPNDVFAVEDEMTQSDPTPATTNSGFITRGGPMEIRVPNPNGYGGDVTNATWSVIQLGQNVRVHRIKRVIGDAILWHEYVPPNVLGDPLCDFEFDEPNGWVKRVERVVLSDHFERASPVQLNGSTAGEWSYATFDTGIWHGGPSPIDVNESAAWIETPDEEVWAHVLYVPFDKTLEGNPVGDGPVPVGYSDGVLSTTISKMPKRPILPTTCRAGLIFRAQNLDNLWYFAADVTNNSYKIGQRKNGVNTDSLQVPNATPADGDTLVVNCQTKVIAFAVLNSFGEVKGSSYIANDPTDFLHVHSTGAPGTEVPEFVDFLEDETWHGIFTTKGSRYQPAPFPNLVGYQTGEALFSLLKFRACPIPYDVPIIIEYDRYTYSQLSSAGGSKKVHFHKDGKVQVGYVRSDAPDRAFTPIQAQAPGVATTWSGGTPFYTFQLRRSVPLYAPNGKNIYNTSATTTLGEPRKPLLGWGTQVGIYTNNQNTGDTHPDWVRIDLVLNDDTSSVFYNVWEAVGGYYNAGEPNETGLSQFVGGLIPVGLEHGSSPTQINLVLDEHKVFRMNPIED